MLCHGDVSPEHVFVDAELRVSGLINWGMWHGGSAIGELAYVANTYGWTDLQAVLEGHGWISLDDDPELRRALATSLVGQLIGNIAHHVTIRDRAGADRNVAVLRQAVRILER